MKFLARFLKFKPLPLGIATGRGVRRLKVLRKRYGGQRWRKRKGYAKVRLANNSVRRAEVHWYEAHGVGRKAWKIKRFMD